MARAVDWLTQARSGPEGLKLVAQGLALSTDPNQARLAAFALLRAEIDGARTALWDALSGPSPMVRSVALEVVATRPEPAAVAVLTARARDEPEPWLRRRAVEALAALPSAGARDAVLHLVDDPDPGVRAVAVRCVRRKLVELPAEVWLPRLAVAAADPVAEVAWHACIGLGQCGTAGAVPPLRRALGHDSVFVAGQAAVQLTWLGIEGHAPDPQLPLSLDGVRKLDVASEQDVRRAAGTLVHAANEDAILAAVGRLAGAALPVATEALAGAVVGHPHARVRAQALRALDGRSGPEVWDAIGHYARHEPDPERQRAAVWTAARRREPEALSLLLSLATDAGVVGEAAVAGLVDRVHRSGRARTPEVELALARALRRGSEAARAHAAAGLARFPTETASRALRRATQTDPTAE